MDQSGEYTKHYYADALRIASKIGSGFSQNLCDEMDKILNGVDPSYLDERRDRQYEEMMEELTELINGNQIMDINPIPYPEADLCNLFGDEREDALFFYHPDHLGSTGMVTDNSSNITQGMLYAPFGEIICDYNPTFHDSPMPNYAFNAKELDEENNMYYYSARYYAPPTFISRDPMFEKYPSISPYTYCGNNPVKNVDPTGEDEYEFNQQGELINRIENKKADIVRVLDNEGNKLSETKPYQCGTVQQHKNDEGKNYFSIKGDNNAKEIFETLANKSTVEWGHAKLGKGGDNGQNYLFTSNDKEHINIKLSFPTYIREYNHSHPNGDRFPSGVRSKKGIDIFSAKNMSLFNMVNFQHGDPKFNIYTPGSDGKGEYTPYTTIEDVIYEIMKDF